MTLRQNFVPVTVVLTVFLSTLARAQELNRRNSSSDPPEQVREMERLLPTASDSGAVVYELARRWWAVGEKDKALIWLEKLASLDQGWDPSGDEAWTRLFSD